MAYGKNEKREWQQIIEITFMRNVETHIVFLNPHYEDILINITIVLL